MRTLFRSLFLVLFLVLVVSNLYIFISGIKLGEKISFYEQKTKKLHQQNIELEKKAYEANSLQYVASEAGTLEFTKRVEPIYLDNLKYAFRK